ncbi:unnamed protein product [Mytilus coruscus]|uniref:Uncharacterized protein n=1 Tax=Mytilus coruscus TaxID=42192 RepID=A0A6J8AFL5_MYTCO|nr:unnamed protein product [Mytilus coruscus]
MQIFNGRGSITWEAFIYQFERTAGRRQWENRKKVCRLLDCLADVALEYARKVNTDDDSKALRKALKQRFSKKDDQTRLEPKHSSEDIKTKILQDIVAVDWPINITLGLLINIIVEDHQINGRSPDQYTRGRSPEQYNRADNEDSETVTLRGLGEQLITGKIIKNTSLNIDRVNIQWNVCKGPLTDDVILGLDILDTLGAVINLSTPTLTINNKVINAAFVNSGGEISIQQVCIKRTITVPPNSEMTVTIKTNKSADQEFILEPCPLTSCVLVSHVDGKGNSCPLTILNDGNRHIRLKKGTPIGYIE